MKLVTVDGAFGSAPTVDVYSPLHASETVFEDVVVGEGTTITTEDQLVLLEVTLLGGETGETIVQSPATGDLAQVRPLSEWSAQVPGFGEALECATEGSRVAVALAPDGLTPEIATGLGLAQDESAVAVIDVRKVYLPRADGEDQFVEGHGMPTVVRAENGQPGIIVPDATPPDEVAIEVLKKGDGEAVTGDAPVRVHYTGVTWDERTVFDSSWENGAPVSLTLDGVVPGFAEALEGQEVGSQILVVIPPEDGYGDQAQGNIPAGSTLVFVIDILGIDTVPAV